MDRVARAAFRSAGGIATRLARAAADAGHPASADASASGASITRRLAPRSGLPPGPLVAHVNVTSEAPRARGAAAGRGRPSRRPPVRRHGAGGRVRPREAVAARRASPSLRRLIERDGSATVLVGTRADAGVCQEIAAAARRQPGAGAAVIDLSGRTDLDDARQRARAGARGRRQRFGRDAPGGCRRHQGGRRVRRDQRVEDRAAGGGRRRARAASIVAADVWCRPCMLRECPIDHRCMTADQRADGVPRPMRRAAFLDRDGTILDELGYLTPASEIVIYPWSIDAIRLLKRAGYAVVIDHQSGRHRSRPVRSRLRHGDARRAHGTVRRTPAPRSTGGITARIIPRPWSRSIG